MKERPRHSPAAPAEPLPLERFAAILDTYGALPARWPAIERPAALALLRSSEEARTLRIQAGRLDLVLDQLRPPLPTPDLSSRLKRRGPAGARARWQREQRRIGLLLPRIGPALKYGAVALVAFIIGFAIAWPLHQERRRPLPQSASEETISSEAQGGSDVLAVPPGLSPAPAPAPPQPRASADQLPPAQS